MRVWCIYKPGQISFHAIEVTNRKGRASACKCIYIYIKSGCMYTNFYQYVCVFVCVARASAFMYLQAVLRCLVTTLVSSPELISWRQRDVCTRKHAISNSLFFFLHLFLFFFFLLVLLFNRDSFLEVFRCSNYRSTNWRWNTQTLIHTVSEFWSRVVMSMTSIWFWINKIKKRLG